MTPIEDAKDEVNLLVAREIVAARAWRQLQDAAALAPSLLGENSPRIRFWDDGGGFTNSSEPWTLTVFESILESETELILREATWRKMSDYQALQHLTRNQ